MSDITKKQDETQDSNKRHRGRPRKEPPKQISEVSERLEMTAKNDSKANEKINTNTIPENVTVKDINTNLTRLYNSLLGSSGLTSGWEGGIFNFNMYNPFLQNQRLKMLNTYPNELDPDKLSQSLSNPGGSELALRGAGWSLSSSQYLYYKILRLAADIPMFKYYKIPELLGKDEYNEEKFINEDIYINNWLVALDVVNTFKRISLEVKREGKPSYILRNSIRNGSDKKKTVNYAAFQKLPSDYVKLTGIGEHGFIASLNLMMFLNPSFSLSQYPDYITKIWEALMNNGVVYERTDKVKKDESKYAVDIDKLREFSYQTEDGGENVKGIITVSSGKGMKAVNYMYWVQLPQEVCYTFCSDSSNPWAIPDTAGLFLGLRELTDYDTLAGLIQSTPLTALLTAEAETVANPNPGQNQTVLSPETIAGFQDKFNGSTSTNLEGFFAPLKNFKLLSLPNIPNSSDITSNATKNFVSRAGLAGLLPATDKPSVAQIKGSQLIEEAACDFVTKQFESVLNFIINNLIGCEYKWRVYLWGNIFTFDNEVKHAKELFIGGANFVLPKLASAYNMTLRDVKATQLYIDSLDIYSEFKTITQAQQEKLINSKKDGSAGTVTVSETETKVGAGRPEMDISEVENDNTAASKESGLDTADMRDFEFDGHCIICGAESDEALCEECKEKYLEEV